MTVNRALLMLAACYVLPIPTGFLGCIVYIAGPLLSAAVIFAFYGYVLFTLWQCFRWVNGGFGLAFLSVGLHLGLGLFTFARTCQWAEDGALFFLFAGFVAVACSAGWLSHRLGRWKSALALVATGVLPMVVPLTPFFWEGMAWFWCYAAQFGLVLSLALFSESLPAPVAAVDCGPDIGFQR